MTARGRCVIVGSDGAVGRMLAGWLRRADATVVGIDPRAGSRSGTRPGRSRGDVTDPDPDTCTELAMADIVVLAVPEPVAVAALPVLVNILRPGTLLVDTLSVKGRYVTAARRAGAASAGLEMLGLNPMFAPSLPADGRPVAAVPVLDGPRARRIRELVGAVGARVVTVTAAEHDRLVAATQALTHAAVLVFGHALAELDVDVNLLAEIAPPPHVTMLGLLARITGGTPEVYWDIQAANPHAPAARAALVTAARELAALVEDPAAELSFTALLGRLHGFLGDQARRHDALCAHLFAALAER